MRERAVEWLVAGLAKLGVEAGPIEMGGQVAETRPGAAGGS